MSPEPQPVAVSVARAAGGQEVTVQLVLLVPPGPGSVEIGGGAAPRRPALTAREAEVLRSLADGLSNTEIARRLFIGDATVKSHVAQIIAKLGVRDRLQAVVAAFRLGLVEVGCPEPPDRAGGRKALTIPPPQWQAARQHPPRRATSPMRCSEESPMTPMASGPAPARPTTDEPTAQPSPEPSSELSPDPWPEPWRAERAARPRTQYWDIETACWHCDEAVDSVPAPRSGD